jgi:hypothetical protein
MSARAEGDTTNLQTLGGKRATVPTAEDCVQ